MPLQLKNIFADIPAELPGELFQTLAGSDEVTIERIVSRGQASAENFWYDQEKNEFVLLLSGMARVAFADHEAAVSLAAGDFLIIPAHCRHRVEWTDPERDTVWLAVHY